MEAMKLEIERLRLNLSTAERYRALLAVSTDPASINPNLLLDDLQMIRFCRITSLAMVGQAALEDKITKSIGLEKNDDDVIDFWNVSGFRQSCVGGVCEVHAENGGGGANIYREIISRFLKVFVVFSLWEKRLSNMLCWKGSISACKL
ncbi:hypothetical protein SOVF_010800 [Spinacia oleracea]|nr:hypothetical protein SOVF_010800 [Spinacia oleracea]